MHRSGAERLGRDVSVAVSAQGFRNLYTLEKGIQNYMSEKGDDLWNGSLFVFDARMAVGPGDPAIATIIKNVMSSCAARDTPRHLLHRTIGTP